MAKLARSLKLQLVSLGIGTLVIVAMVGFVITHHKRISFLQEGIIFIVMTIAVGLQWWISRDIEKGLKK